MRGVGEGVVYFDGLKSPLILQPAINRASITSASVSACYYFIPAYTVVKASDKVIVLR